MYRPPAAQSDIVTAVENYGAQTIGLIDGTFRQSLSVWHGEILYALSRGVTVFGASSMGALRAAETAIFGTRGIGHVYAWYADGTITCDDEVALAYAETDDGYRKISEPLVNVRATLAAAVDANRLTQTQHDLVLDLVRRRYFPERTIAALLHDLRDKGWIPDQVDMVRDIFKSNYIDVKRDDAVACLEAIRDADCRKTSDVAPTFEFARPYVFETLYNLDRRVTHNKCEVPLQMISEHFTLHSPDFAEVREAALNRGLLVFMMHLLEIEPTNTEMAVEEDRFRSARGLVSHADVDEWCRQNDLNCDELQRIFRDSAGIARMQRWLLGNRGLDRGVRYFLDELRMRGTYKLWAEAAAAETTCADSYADEYHRALPGAEILCDQHLAATGIRAELSPDWAADAGFEDVEVVVDGLRRAAIHRDVTERIRIVVARLCDRSPAHGLGNVLADLGSYIAVDETEL
jgi:hypothetical protein